MKCQKKKKKDNRYWMLSQDSAYSQLYQTHGNADSSQRDSDDEDKEDKEDKDKDKDKNAKNRKKKKKRAKMLAGHTMTQMKWIMITMTFEQLDSNNITHARHVWLF